jgi:hypothetical protein
MVINQYTHKQSSKHALAEGCVPAAREVRFSVPVPGGGDRCDFGENASGAFPRSFSVQLVMFMRTATDTERNHTRYKREYLDVKMVLKAKVLQRQARGKCKLFRTINFVLRSPTKRGYTQLFRPVRWFADGRSFTLRPKVFKSASSKSTPRTGGDVVGSE